MDVLNEEKTFEQIQKFVEPFMMFKKVFHEKGFSALMKAPEIDFSLREFLNNGVSDDEVVRYFDLSKCKSGDYELIIKVLSDGAEGVLFDNIDRVPNIEDREEIEYLVRMALKRDTLPTKPSYPISELDFSGIMVGARCEEIPEYLTDKSLQMIIITSESKYI